MVLARVVYAPGLPPDRRDQLRKMTEELMGYLSDNVSVEIGLMDVTVGSGCCVSASVPFWGRCSCRNVFSVRSARCKSSFSHTKQSVSLFVHPVSSSGLGLLMLALGY